MGPQLAVGPHIENVRSDRALQLKLLASGLPAVGGLARFLRPPLNADAWSDALTIFGIWSAIAVLAWLSALLGALLLLVGAALGGFAAFTALFALAISDIDKKHPHNPAALFWLFLLWWAGLPIVSALLLVAAHRTRPTPDRDGGFE